MTNFDFFFQPSLQSEASFNNPDTPPRSLRLERSEQSLISSLRELVSKQPAGDDYEIPPIPPVPILPPPQVGLPFDGPLQVSENVETISRSAKRKDSGVQAWIVCFGTWCAFTSSFGWLNSVGVFQDYYRTHFLQHYSDSDIS